MYPSVYIKCEIKSITFYTAYLNFKLYENVKLNNNEEWWILRNNEMEKIGLILIKRNPKKLQQSTLVLNIGDCIFEYCKLKRAKVKKLSKPLYSSIGLSLNLIDPSGNKIMLLEERKYLPLEGQG